MKASGYSMVLTVVLGAVVAEAKPATMRPRDVVAAGKRYQAELRAEANEPGPGRLESRRITEALTARRAASDRKIAEYAKFKFAQRIAMAQATMPGSQMTFSAPSQEQQFAPARYIKTAYQSRSNPADEVPLPTRRMPRANSEAAAQPYPNSFYRMQALEESMDRLSTQLETSAGPAPIDDHAFVQMPTNPQDAPIAVSMRGRPGYAISPYSRTDMIDVRGYESDTVVVDPNSGRRVRVP